MLPRMSGSSIQKKMSTSQNVLEVNGTLTLTVDWAGTSKIFLLVRPELVLGQCYCGIWLWMKTMGLEWELQEAVPIVGGLLLCLRLAAIHVMWNTTQLHTSLNLFGKKQRINTAMLREQSLESVAFENTDGSVVAVVLNTSWDQSKSFQVSLDYEYF